MSNSVRISFSKQVDIIYCEVCGDEAEIPLLMPRKVSKVDKQMSKEKKIIEFAKWHKQKCKAETNHLLSKENRTKG